MPRTFARRTLLTGAAGSLIGLAACSSRSNPPAGSPSATAGSASASVSTTASASASSSSSTSVSASAAVLPATTPWVPGAGEIEPDVKLRAVQLVEAIGAWPPGGAGAAAARTRVSALGLDPALVGQAPALLPPGDQAALQVIDAQYGGILADSASVLVVCDQWTASAGGPVTPGGTAVDVRLIRAQPRWTVTELHPAQPGAASTQLSAPARQVLADTRIELPPASRADISSGAVHDSVLQAMLTLAQTYSYSVSVVRSGHPLDVFGTDRPSDHPLGKAFDVWRIDGRAVVDPATPTTLVDGFMRAAAAAGSYNVGGPRQLSGGTTANQFFSDNTHHDHVHIGFLT